MTVITIDQETGLWKNRIEVIQGDIIQQHVDAIVNLTNKTLLGSGREGDAIHRAAGLQLLEECNKLGGCYTGQAKITRGYNLLAKWILHTAVPTWHGGQYNEDHLLAKCYRSCLSLAAQHSMHTIAFPAISMGSYGFPIDRATRIAIAEAKKFLMQDRSIDRVTFICFRNTTYQVYLSQLKS